MLEKEATTPDPESQYCSDRLQDARSLIKKYIPQALPQTDATVYIEYVPLGSSEDATGGFYRGNLRGKHYISLDMKEYDFAAARGIKKREFPQVGPISQIMDSVTIAHELFHARVAETVPDSTMIGVDINDLVSDVDIQRLSLEQLFNKVHEERIRRELFPDVTLLWAIDEGIASATELFITRKMIEDAEKANNRELANALRTRESKRLKELESIDKHSSREYYQHGVALVNAYGVDTMINNLGRLDIEECNKILMGSDRYKAIISGAEEIPFIE